MRILLEDAAIRKKKKMRIRLYKPQDADSLLAIAQASAQFDHTLPPNPLSFLDHLSDSALDAFVMTDDDDELQTWGQAGTLEGIEGEVVAYTILTLDKDASGYYFLCQGSVHPSSRHQNAGNVLLVGALNRARLLALDFEFEAEEAGLPIYFSALLPLHDPASPHLAAKHELQPTPETAPPGLQLYRRKL